MQWGRPYKENWRYCLNRHRKSKNEGGLQVKPINYIFVLGYRELHVSDFYFNIFV